MRKLDNVPTGEYLMHRAIHGPTWCVLCKDASESTEHLFLRCNATLEFWRSLSNHFSFNGNWEGSDLIEAWENWAQKHKGSKCILLPILVNWQIWKARNRSIFENRPIIWPLIEATITAAYKELPDPLPPKERHPHPPPCIDKNIPWAFFDGAANHQSCGGGFILHLNEHHYYTVKSGLGTGTNNFAELITLRHLLHFALHHHCTSINIFGDSKTVINWFNGISDCHIHTLSIILNEVFIFKAAFNNISCSHIYREHNGHADKLSKEAALMDRGIWEIAEVKGRNEYRYFHRPYIDQEYQHAPES